MDIKHLPVAAVAFALTTLIRRRCLRRNQSVKSHTCSSWLAAKGNSSPDSTELDGVEASISCRKSSSKSDRSRALNAAASLVLAQLLLTAVVAAIIALLMIRGATYPALAVGIGMGWLLRSFQLQSPHPGGWQPLDGEEKANKIEPVPQKPRQRPPLPPISGTWLKDAASSDSFDPIMEVMKLNGLLRGAIRLIRGVEIKLDEEEFTFAAFSVVKWFKISESYKMDGSVCLARRRDFRGRWRGVVCFNERGNLSLSYEWDAPMPGRGEDEFILKEDGRLLHVTTNWVQGQMVTYTSVYVRPGKGRGAASLSGGAAAAHEE